MLKPLHLATILLLVFISTTRSVAICYRADTHEAQSSAFTPCNGQRQHSMCYRAQTTLWEGVPDWQRYPNGITVDGTGNCWRQGCTDRTWASPFCLSAFSGCPNDYHRNARLTPCSDYASNATRWCCGHDNTTCCERDAIVIPVVLGYSSSTPLPTTAGPSSSLESMNTTTSGISAATLKITVTVTSPTASASASVTPSASADAGLSKGAKSGIGIGVGAFTISAILLGLGMSRRSRKQALSPPKEDPVMNEMGEENNHAGDGFLVDVKQELPVGDAGPAPVELEAGR